MQIYDAVFYTKDSGNDCYIIMKEGDCVFDRRRYVSFKSQAGVNYGDTIKIEFSADANFEDNPYFRILEKKQSKFCEREHNLFLGIRLLINNDYSTPDERNNRAHLVIDDVPFFERNYFDEIGRLFDSLIKFYKKEKMTKQAKFVKDMLNEFEQNSIHTLGITQEEKFENDYGKLCIKRIRKQNYSVFTHTQKIVDGIHELVKNDAIEKLDKIEKFCKECVAIKDCTSNS